MLKNARSLIILGLIAVAGTTYGFSSKSPEEIIAESIRKSNIEINIRNNATVEAYKQSIAGCTTQTGSNTEVLQKLSTCINRPKPKLEELLSDWDSNSGKILVNATGGIAPVPWYTAKHSLVLTGSHSYVQYSHRLGASWKNNNSAGLTWWVSPTLKQLWTDAWIRYRKGSLRPANEKGNYIYFETVEEWLRAKIIAIRERWGKATVQHYLAGWGTDYVKLSFDKSKIISELSDAEFTELFVQQMKKESPGYTNQLVADKILIIK